MWMKLVKEKGRSKDAGVYHPVRAREPEWQ
jgi:hypothetical protein